MDESIIIQPQPIRNHALYRRDSAYPAFVGTKEECIAMRKSWSHKALREGWTIAEYDSSRVRQDTEYPTLPENPMRVFVWSLLSSFLVVFAVLMVIAYLTAPNP